MVDELGSKKRKRYQRLLAKRKRSIEDEQEFQDLQKLLRFRIPVPYETPIERYAQKLLIALLKEGNGEEYPEVTQQVLHRATQLFKELRAKEEKQKGKKK